MFLFIYDAKLLFIKNRMSDDMFSQGKLFKLCQAAPINKELLLKFVQDKMIIEGDIEQIVS